MRNVAQQPFRSVVTLFLLLAVCSAVVSAAPDEIVAFNTETLKYHCLTCRWAVRCTKNCVKIKKSEAIRRGGVACKVCGGTCPR